MQELYLEQTTLHLGDLAAVFILHREASKVAVLGERECSGDGVPTWGPTRKRQVFADEVVQVIRSRPPLATP